MLYDNRPVYSSRTSCTLIYIQGGNSAVVRQQAGVQLKNFLYTNDESLRAHYEDRWLAMPEDIRNYTKVKRYISILHEWLHL